MVGGSSWSWTGGKARRRRSGKGVLCRMNWTLSRLYSFLGSKMFTCMTGAEIEQRKQRSESGRNPIKNSSRRLGVEVRALGRIAGEIGASEQRCKTQNECGCLTKHYLTGYSNIETGGRPTVANLMCHVTEHVFSPGRSIISALIPSLITIYSTEFCKDDH
jgi:hypothetical protein